MIKVVIVEHHLEVKILLIHLQTNTVKIIAITLNITVCTRKIESNRQLKICSKEFPSLSTTNIVYDISHAEFTTHYTLY